MEVSHTKLTTRARRIRTLVAGRSGPAPDRNSTGRLPDCFDFGRRPSPCPDNVSSRLQSFGIGATHQKLLPP